MPTLPSLRPALRRALAVGSLAFALLATNPALTTTGAPAKAATATPRTAAAAPAARPSLAAQRIAHRRSALRTKTWRAFLVAARQKGDPYRYGASGPRAFDCSGLTSYAYRHAGLRLPRTSSAQAGQVRHIRRSSLRRGDLVFFTHGRRVYHVGLFAGFRHGRPYVLHAPYSGTRVRTERIWTNSWFGGTRRI